MRFVSGLMLFLLITPTAVIQADDCPQLAGSYPYGSSVGVAVSGNYAFYSSGPSLMVADVSNLTQPQVIGEVALPGVIEAIEISGWYAYVAASDAGLQVVDISDPALPVVVGYLDTPSPALDVSVSGGYAFVATGDTGLRKIDVVDPLAPTETGFIDPPNHDLLAVSVLGNFAYVLVHYKTFPLSDGEPYVWVINVSHPSYLFDTGHVLIDNTNYFEIGGDIAVSGNTAFSVGFGYLNVLDVSDPYSPDLSGSSDLGYTDGTGVAVSPGYVFVTHNHDLRVFDVSVPASPTEAGSIETPGIALGVAVGGLSGFVADSNKGLRAINISSPSNPFEVGFIDAPGSTESVVVSGGIAYVADKGDGLRILDVSDPSSPSELGSIEILGEAVDLAVSGQFAYVIEKSGVLRVLDVSDPTTPHGVGFVDTGAQYAYDLTVSGTYAFVAGGNDGLRVIDISLPSSPLEVAHYYSPHHTVAVSVSGDFAYVADYQEGLRVVDIGNPTTPYEVGEYQTGGARAVSVAGDYAYLAQSAPNPHRWLFRINISDPYSPQSAGMGLLPVDPLPVDVAILGDTVYVAIEDHGMLAFDGDDFSMPVVGEVVTPGASSAISTSEELLFLADGEGGLQIFHGCVDSGMFIDGFESGDTSAWSLSSP